MKREEKKAVLQQKIVTTASDLYLKNGASKTTMRSLADIVGISTATLYQYFSDKPSLTRAVIINVLGDMNQDILEAVQDEMMTFPQIVQHLKKRTATVIAKANPEFWDTLFEAYQTDPQVISIYNSDGEVWQSFIARGRQAGYIDSELGDTAVMFFFDMFFQYFKNRVNVTKLEQGGADMAKLEQDIDRLLFQGLFGEKYRASRV